MKLRAEERLDAPAAAVVAALHDVERWAGRLPGVVAAAVTVGGPRAVEVHLRLGTPREIRVLVEVERLDDGVAWAMVQGDLSDTGGEIRVRGDGDGCVVALSGDATFPVGVPSTLLREIAVEALPRLLRALG